VNTSLLRHIQDMSDRDLENANEEAIALECRTTRKEVRVELKAERERRKIGEWR
jgi:hypothetical protein